MSGGMLPYWVDSVNGTEGEMSAIYAINTSPAVHVHVGLGPSLGRRH